MAASLLQGGPPPRFLANWVYEYIVSGDQLLNSVAIEDIQSEITKEFANKVIYYHINFIFFIFFKMVSH